MGTEKDIFDKTMELPILRILNSFYKKNKELLLYLFFGGLTFLVSISSYAVFSEYCFVDTGSCIRICDKPDLGV